jgi:predicted nucleotidyltransferase component of viral defense system
MAGGSSLALQLGHRISVDFDFFSESLFETIEVKNELLAIGKYKGSNETPKTMVGVFNEVKFSLFHYPYPLIEKTNDFIGIQLASLADIAAMKLVAITDRGTKKDYIDIYFLAQKCFSIEEMSVYYDRKYHNLDTNKMTLLKALQYFDDADESAMPDMLIKISWEEIKDFFRKEVINLAEKYLR